MRLTPTERDRLLLFSAAELARARRARGLRLNVPEATALISDTVIESARDGARLAESIEALARSLLGPDDVLPGVADLLPEVWVEAVFDDGSRLVVVEDPIGGGSLGDAGPGAILTADAAIHPHPAQLVEITVDQHGRRPDQRDLALPLLRGQPTARLRPGRRLRSPPGDRRGRGPRFDPGQATSVDARPDRRCSRRHRVRRPGGRSARRPRSQGGSACEGNGPPATSAQEESR